MSIIKIKKNTVYTLVIWEIQEDINSLLQQLQPTTEELIEIEKFKNQNRKKQNIVSRLILNQLATKKVKLNYSDNGVPLCTIFKHISISHSKNFCSVIGSQNKIGIDIQYYKKNILEISPKFINQTEKTTSKENKEILHFIWCAKEAIYKTLNGITCSFKENIHVKDIKNKHVTRGYYLNGEKTIKYDVYCEKIELYFMAIATIKL